MYSVFREADFVRPCQTGYKSRLEEGGDYISIPAPPRGPTPYPFMCHFGRKGIPFIYLVLKKGPIHIGTLGSLDKIFM